MDAISCSVEVPSSQATKISQQGKRPAGWGYRKRGAGEMNAKGWGGWLKTSIALFTSLQTNVEKKIQDGRETKQLDPFCIFFHQLAIKDTEAAGK